MSPAFSQQYELVRDARAALLAYCATLRPEDFTAPVPAFNHNCIRDLLVHVAGAYHVWLGQVALGQAAAPTPPAEVPDVAAARRLYARVDALVADFARHVAPTWLVQRAFHFPRHPAPLQLSPLQLFTHVITHEFHHKGQALSMSRLLGYTPADTDVVRF
ncbi:MAG TPA: DinB family protein [Hymenobacter sp.]|jgi:uncharacterized damage-inducible protein DinB|uniref:DinB family protein n=1 Tax=Hymenobacter sp. TaxID=1898978 RepID=UPI002ED77E26